MSVVPALIVHQILQASRRRQSGGVPLGDGGEDPHDEFYRLVGVIGVALGVVMLVGLVVWGLVEMLT